MKNSPTYRITGVSNLTDIRVAISPFLSLPVAMYTCQKWIEANDTIDGSPYRDIRIEPTQSEELPLIFLPYDHKQ